MMNLYICFELQNKCYNQTKKSQILALTLAIWPLFHTIGRFWEKCLSSITEISLGISSLLSQIIFKVIFKVKKFFYTL